MTNVRAVCLSSAFLACITGAAKAAENVGLTPRVFANYSYDNNLFRVSGEAESRAVLGTSDPSDRIFEFGAGADYRISVSQQLFRLSADVARHQYDTFDFLNYTGGSATALWDWKYGTRFDGDLKFNYRRDILGFEELSSPVQDKRTFIDLSGSGNYMLASRLQLHLEAARSEQSHSREAQSSLDRTVNRVIGELRYTSARNSYIGFRSVARMAKYPNREVVQTTTEQLDNSYKEYEYSLTVNWVESVNSSLTGRVGWTKRAYDDVSARDFSGVTGRFSYGWTPSTRFGANVSIWRDLDAYSDQVSSYVDEIGAKVEGRWAFSPKLTLKVDALKENRKYDGDPGIALAPTINPRRDRVVGYGTGLAYAFRERLNFSLGYDKEYRESNRADQEYDDYIVRAGVEATF